MPPRLPSLWKPLPPPFLLPSSCLPRIPKRGIKYGWSDPPPRSKPARFNQRTSGLPVLSATPAAALARKDATLPLRTGALAIKKGMTAMYDMETGKRIPCTVLQFDRVQVVSHKTRAKHGYFAVQIGAGAKTTGNVTRPLLGHYAAQQISPKRYLSEFRVKNEEGLLKVGELLGPDWFIEGQFVDARANCRGMGFEGGMKRWGFKGQGASHGNSKNHRTMGSSGGGQGSGSRVLPGKKMPGNMGGQQVTVQNLKVLKVDATTGIIVLSGCLAGPKGCVVKIQDAIKKPWPVVPVIEAQDETASTAEKILA